MVDAERNRELNQKLEKLYLEKTPKFLDEYESWYKERKPSLLDFGIIDPERYDTDDGILIVMKEADGWDYEGADGATYLDFVHDVIEGKNKSGVTMQTWYNPGRWVTAIRHPDKPTEEIAEMFGEALQALRMAAITNINKVTGGARSGSRYDNLAKSDIAVETFQEEVRVLKPRYIIFCQTQHWFQKEYLDELRERGCRILTNCHPTAPISKIKMIEDIKKQLK